MHNQGGALFPQYYDLRVLKTEPLITQLSNSSLVATYSTAMK